MKAMKSLAVWLVFVFPWLVAAPAHAQLGFLNLNSSFTSRSPGSTNGYDPYQLILGQDGNLYGILLVGGPNGYGTIFGMKTNGALQWTLGLTAADGENAYGLLQGQDGNLYVRTYAAVLSVGTNGHFNWSLSVTNYLSWMIQGSDGNLYGAQSSNALGAIISLSTNGTSRWTVLLNQTNGAHPSTLPGTLLQGTDGNLYGTAASGGAHNDGVVFSMTTGGVFNWEFSFAGTNGSDPVGALIQGSDGSLYGMAGSGGAQGTGAIFNLSTNGVQRWIYSFPSHGGQYNPSGVLLQGTDGNLYSFYATGGLFSLSTNGALLWSVATSAVNDGVSLLMRKDGNLYGGAFAGTGDLFSVSSSGQIVATYTTTNELQGSGELVQDAAGNIYGVMSQLQTLAGGQVFELVAGPVITAQPADVLDLTAAPASFSVTALAAPPFSYQWQKNGTNLSDGGNLSGSHTNTLALASVSSSDAASYSVVISNFFGAVTSAPAFLSLNSSFPTYQSNGTLAIEYSFTGGKLQYPYALVAGTNGTLDLGALQGYLINVTTNGVVNWSQQPSLLHIWTALAQGIDGHIYAVDGEGIISFSNSGVELASVFESSGGGSFAAVVQGPDTKLYWTSVFNSSVYCTSNNLATTYWRYQFANGLAPNGLVLARDGRLYGTTQLGGTYSNGTMFCLTTNGALTWSLTLPGTNGLVPDGLIQGWDGNLYGTTAGDGTNGFGAVFSVSTNGALNWSFALPKAPGGGNFPYPTIMQATDGNLYGTTRTGGSFSQGSIYQITTAGVFTPIYSFSGGSDGSFPSAGLVQVADGTFFGTAQSAGPNNVGVIYRLNLGLPPTPLPPVFQGATLTNGAIALIWSSINGLSYQLQYSADLGAGTWSNAGNAVLANGTTLTVTDTMASPPRFYRVALQPVP
jgi:uncharacterized repeat protein (TIGR03803 family)